MKKLAKQVFVMLWKSPLIVCPCSDTESMQNWRSTIDFCQLLDCMPSCNTLSVTSQELTICGSDGAPKKMILRHCQSAMAKPVEGDSGWFKFIAHKCLEIYVHFTFSSGQPRTLSK